MILTYGDFLHPFSVSLNGKNLQIRLFNLITIKEYHSSLLRMPIKTNYLSENVSTYLKYFSLLACWKNKKKNQFIELIWLLIMIFFF